MGYVSNSSRPTRSEILVPERNADPLGHDEETVKNSKLKTRCVRTPGAAAAAALTQKARLTRPAGRPLAAEFVLDQRKMVMTAGDPVLVHRRRRRCRPPFRETT
jgi:hypothetical protein